MPYDSADIQLIVRASMNRRCSVTADKTAPGRMFHIDNLLPMGLFKKLVHEARRYESIAEQSPVVTEGGAQEEQKEHRSSRSLAFSLDSHVEIQVCARLRDMMRLLGSELEEPPAFVFYSGPEESFGLHHDAGTIIENEVIIEDGARSWRPWTLFVYLTTNTKGGRTVFPELNLSLSPKENTAILFRNGSDEGELDMDMCHFAEPLLDDGLKVGINVFSKSPVVTPVTPVTTQPSPPIHQRRPK